MVDDGIRWERLDRERFDALVEALLSRVHNREGHEVLFPEGKGGDGGRDAIATVHGRTIVYQFKFFPEGLSTSGSSRKRQIQRSFQSALAYNPDEWVLVVPGKLTDAFRRLVRDLPKGTKVKVTVWDRPQLDSMIAAHPDLVELIDRDALLERARTLGVQSLLLDRGIVDAVAHRTSLQDALNNLHPYWGLLLADKGSGPTFSFVPKTKDAQKRSPLGLKVEVSYVGVDDPLGDRLGDAERYGRPGVTVIPRDRIVSLEPFGMEWAGISADGPLPDRLEFHVPSLESVVGRAVTLEALDASGQQKGTFPGRSTGGNRGNGGLSLVVQFFDCITMTLLMPEPGRESGEDVRVDVKSVSPVDPAAAAKSTALNLALFESASFKIDIDGRHLATFRRGCPQQDGGTDQLRKVHEFVSDLNRIQQETSVFFDVPDEISGQDRVWARCVRLMLEGKAVLVPGGTFTGRPNPGTASEPPISDDGLGAIVFDRGRVLELCGHRIPIPTVRCYHPIVRLDGVREAFADSRSDNPRGLGFTMTATGNDAFLAFMPERYSRETVTATPWNLTGICEPLPLPTTVDGQVIDS